MDCLISLGANLGGRRAAISRAARRLADDPSVERLRLSRLHETQPVGGPGGQPTFFNAAARLETSFAPDQLLARLQRIEDEAGRQRVERWGPRTIDVDLLLYGDRSVQAPGLRVPHPRMAWRRFVLEPAAEVAADMVHPTTGWTIGRLRDHLDATPHYLALTGSIGAGKTRLAERLSQAIDGHLIREPLDPDRLADFYADPTSRAWATELEFLTARRLLLARPDRGEPGASEMRVPASEFVVSDFWFDQSAAFARVWLDQRQYAEYRERFEAARQQVGRARLTVLLRASAEELQRRIQQRGRPGELELPSETLGRIAAEIDRETRKPDVGPVLRLDNESANADAVFAEVIAAVEAMR